PYTTLFRSVYGRAISRVADVVPDCCAVCVRRDGVDIVAQELEPQVVLAGAPWVARRAPVELRECAEHATADVCMLDDANQRSQARGVVAERRRERVVDEVGVPSIWGDRDRRIVAAIAECECLLSHWVGPGVAAVRRVAREDVRVVDAVAPVDPRAKDLVS